MRVGSRETPLFPRGLPPLKRGGRHTFFFLPKIHPGRGSPGNFFGGCRSPAPKMCKQVFSQNFFWGKHVCFLRGAPFFGEKSPFSGAPGEKGFFWETSPGVKRVFGAFWAGGPLFLGNPPGKTPYGFNPGKMGPFWWPLGFFAGAGYLPSPGYLWLICIPVFPPLIGLSVDF